MAFALVYGAEHYVSDILLGWLYTVVTVLAASAVARWWAERVAGCWLRGSASGAPAAGRARAAGAGRAGVCYAAQLGLQAR